MEKKERVPAIRFEGFNEPWEKRKFSELYERVSEKNDLTYGKDEIISVANMYFKSDSYITDQEYLRTYNVFHIGDIAFEGNKSKNFAHGRFVENTIGNGIVSHVFDVFRPITEYDLLFWKYVINNERIMGSVLVRCTKASTMMTNLVASDFLQESILVPSVEEQQRIGAFLDQLDNLITLHQRKYEKLVKIKKSMLEKMFPREGSSFPEIRFAGFTDPWEQRKVGEITIESTEYATLDAGYPLLTSSRSGLMYQNEYRGNLTTDSKDTLFSVVPMGACTYRHMSDDDVFHLNINALEKGLVSREYPVFFAAEGNCLAFIVQHINSSTAFRSFCAEQKKGGTRTRLYYNALCSFSMMAPSHREQEEIADFFGQLDRLITLHQRKLERLQTIKESMLEKMFV